ncbi:MAG TPA: polysaccharide deacetylase family protein [Symbiobacteriaceae bacterium]
MQSARSLRVLTAAVCVLMLTLAGRSQAETVPQGVLRHGDRGPEVAALQQTLKAAGFNPGVVDGIFGSRTEAAVREAQKALGVTVDGIAGPVTLAALQAKARPAEETVRLVVHAAAGAEAEEAVEEPEAAGVQQFALTFNGVPDPEVLPEILSLLDEYEMQATFFLPGEAAERAPGLVAAIAKAGHEIGTQGFADVDMTRMTEQMQIAHLRRSVQAIVEAAGTKPAFFRPPQGRFSAGLLRVAAMEGLRPILWTNVAMAATPDTTAQRLSNQLLRSVYPGAVLMVHQDHPATVDALRLLLPRLRARGFESVTLSQLLPAGMAKAE